MKSFFFFKSSIPTNVSFILKLDAANKRNLITQYL
ncbi:hypothetical protein OIU76_027819 [Salix suchowensis]|nr:hypothetical protein OIU76_027819 [Salix suchowensis]